MIPQPRPLIEVFADIPDVRKARGKRHPLSAILALSCCAMLCGSRSYSAIADWGRNYWSAIADFLGLTQPAAWVGTMDTIYVRIDCVVFGASLEWWIDSVLANPAVA